MTMGSDSAPQVSRDVETHSTIVPPKPAQDTDMDWREYQFFREELRHEDNLINQRVSWLVGSQAFLLGAFATLIASFASKVSGLDGLRNYMLIGLPVAGVAGVLANYVAILGAVIHVHGVRRYVANKHPPQMPSLGKWHRLPLRMGLFGPLVTPLIFLAFWAIILIKIQ